jgi:thiol-disulfide isomerase/thioredoxin
MNRIFLLIPVFFFAFNAQSQEIPKMKITDIENYISSAKEEVLVINFWATFCKPCVAEIPAFIKVANQYQSQHVKLMLVSLDLPSYYPIKIAGFAKKNKFEASIAWLNETNADYFCPKIDAKWSGSIPATLFVNTKTGYRKFFEEEMDAATFETELKQVIKGS